MASNENLRRILNRIDGKGYPAYKDIRGTYQFPTFSLLIDHVQGDPFAAPSRLRVQVPQTVARYPSDTYELNSRNVALADFLTRAFDAACSRLSRTGRSVARRRGSGKSGLMAIDRPGQQVLERSSVLIDEETVEARFVVGLPAARALIWYG